MNTTIINAHKSQTYTNGYNTGYNSAQAAECANLTPSIAMRQDHADNWREWYAGFAAGCNDWAKYNATF